MAFHERMWASPRTWGTASIQRTQGGSLAHSRVPVGVRRRAIGRRRRVLGQPHGSTPGGPYWGPKLARPALPRGPYWGPKLPRPSLTRPGLRWTPDLFDQDLCDSGPDGRGRSVLVRDEEVVGSNPASPTKSLQVSNGVWPYLVWPCSGRGTQLGAQTADIGSPGSARLNAVTSTFAIGVTPLATLRFGWSEEVSKTDPNPTPPTGSTPDGDQSRPRRDPSDEVDGLRSGERAGSTHNAPHRELLGTSPEEPRDQLLESAPTFPGDLLVEGLSDAEEVSFLLAIADLGPRHDLLR